LNSDIANLIAASKVEFAQNPYDGSIQTRLKALLDLQSILQSQKLPPEQIALIKDQVAQLSIAAKPQPPPTPVVQPPAPTPVTVSQPPTQQPTLASLLGGSDALAALLARASATPQAPTPPPQPVLPVRSPQPQYAKPQYPPVPPPASNSTAVVDPNSLLEKLRAAGMLPPAPPVASTPPIASNSLASNGVLPAGFPPQLPYLNKPFVSSTTRSPLNEIPNDVQLKPASLKM
jgi:pre-mRNA cleavage complex 2 protein Pcf11